MKIKLVLVAVLVMMGLLVGWFYWFQLRPSYIRKGCYKEIENLPGEVLILLDDSECKTTYEGGVSCVKKEAPYDKLFRVCLNKNGLR